MQLEAAGTVGFTEHPDTLKEDEIIPEDYLDADIINAEHAVAFVEKIETGRITNKSMIATAADDTTKAAVLRATSPETLAIPVTKETESISGTSVKSMVTKIDDLLRTNFVVRLAHDACKLPTAPSSHLRCLCS